MNKIERAATKEMIDVQHELEKRLLAAEALLREVLYTGQLALLPPAQEISHRAELYQRIKAFLERKG